MAEKRSYLRAVKNEKEENREDYLEKIRKHRMSAVYRLLLVLLAVLVLIVIVYVQYKNHIYTDYDIVATKDFNNVDNSKVMRLGDNILTYSYDGASCTSPKGEVLWNQTFEMQNILTATCEDVVAIADYTFWIPVKRYAKSQPICLFVILQ